MIDNKLPKHWELLKVSDAFNLKTGATPSRSHPEYFGGDIKWIRSGDVNMREIHDCEGRINELGLQNSNTKILPIDSVLIALNGQGKTRGTVAMLKTEATCNQSIIAMISKDKGKYDPKYLYYNLQSRYIEIRNLTGLNERRGLNMALVGGIRVPFPPINEQKRIVKKLNEFFEKYESAIGKLEENAKKTKEVFDSELQQVFLSRNEEWNHKKLKNIIKLEYGKALNTSKRNPLGKYPVYGANGIKTRSSEYHYNKPSIIIGRKGSAGELTLANESFWPLDVTYYVTFDNKKHNLKFLFYLLLKLKLPLLARGVKPGINRNDVYEISVKIPEYEKQIEIAGKLDAIEKSTKALGMLYQKKIANFENLKISVINSAFTGNL